MPLWKSEAKTDKAVADGLGVSVNTVRRCINRYLSSGINLAVFDDERSGRPPEITDDAKSWIISEPVKSPVNLVMLQNYGHWQHCTNTYKHTLKKPASHAKKQLQNHGFRNISKRWILSRSKSSIILNGKTLILRIRCMKSFWYINRSRCSWTIMRISSYRMTGI